MAETEFRLLDPKDQSAVLAEVHLGSSERETFRQCLGWCQVCMFEGGCALQKKLNEGVSHGTEAS